MRAAGTAVLQAWLEQGCQGDIGALLIALEGVSCGALCSAVLSGH